MQVEIARFADILRKQEETIKSMQDCKKAIIKEFIIECNKLNMTDDDIVLEANIYFYENGKRASKIVYEIADELYIGIAPTVKPHIVDKVLGLI